MNPKPCTHAYVVLADPDPILTRQRAFARQLTSEEDLREQLDYFQRCCRKLLKLVDAAYPDFDVKDID